MQVDLGTVFDATPGVTQDGLERLDERVATAHERIERGRRNNEPGYAALNLPETVDTTTIHDAVASFEDPTAILIVGIGGSALGAATLVDALGDDTAPSVYVLDNVDPASISRILESIPLSETVLNVVSRSGTTAETLSNFLVVREAMTKAGVDWTDRTIVTTGTDGNLRQLAKSESLPALSVPEGVPGRFSVLSTVGLVVAALKGIQISELITGAADAAAELSGSLFETPAYAYGATTYALAARGARTNVMMPYAENLETFAEWFAQLWAESLGKDNRGQTPIRALGATDQHSQLQLYRAGPHNKVITLMRPRNRPSCTIPSTDLDGLSYLGGSDLGSLLDAEFEATEASLVDADIPTIRVEINAIDAQSLGALLYEFEAACICYGELASVPTFTQPAVEWGKRAARGLLGDDNFIEAAAVADKPTLRVE